METLKLTDNTHLCQTSLYNNSHFIRICCPETPFVTDSIAEIRCSDFHHGNGTTARGCSDHLLRVEHAVKFRGGHVAQ